MKQRASDSDYLKKEDATSWASCKVQDPYVGTSDYGDTNYLLMGKDYTAPTYFIAQTFMRFDTSAIRDSHEIVSASVRLYIAVDKSDTDFTLWMIVPDTSYGTCDPTDWITTFTTFTTILVNGTTVKTDSGGNKYIDIPLTAEMLALITKTAGSTIEFAFKGNEVSEPTNGQYLKCYSHQYATETLRPYLYIETRGLREQLFLALETTLDTIDEFSGYMTTPNVSGHFKGMPAVTSADCPAIYILTDDEARELTSCRVDDVNWHPHLLAIVREPDETKLRPAMNALITDIKSCLGTNPLLGMSGGIQWSRVETIDTNDTLVIDDNYAAALLRLDVKYLDHVNEP